MLPLHSMPMASTAARCIAPPTKDEYLLAGAPRVNSQAPYVCSPRLRARRPLWRGGGGGGRHHRLPLGGVRRPHGAELLRRELVWAQQVARPEGQLEGEDVRVAAQRLGIADLAK